MVRSNLLIWWAIGLAVLVGAARILPHPPNFTPIIAAAGAVPLVFGNRYSAVLFVFGAMFVGDLVWGFHPYMLYTYGALAVAVFLGYRLHNMFWNCTASAVIFFVITNFGVWLSGYYGYTLLGLWACYTAAIPFFVNTVLGTLFYGVLFEIARSASGKPEPQRG